MSTLNKYQPILKSTLASLVLFVMLVSPTQAFYHNQEASTANHFSASSLGIALGVAQSDMDSKLTRVTADQAQDVEYRIVKSASTGDFCSSLQLVIERDSAVLYSGNLADFQQTAASALWAGDSDDISLDFAVADSSLQYSGDCTIALTYNANQPGYAHGQAFFDSKTDAIIMKGVDFSAPTSPAAPPAPAGGPNNMLPEPPTQPDNSNPVAAGRPAPVTPPAGGPAADTTDNADMPEDSALAGAGDTDSPEDPAPEPAEDTDTPAETPAPTEEDQEPEDADSEPAEGETAGESDEPEPAEPSATEDNADNQ